MNKVKVRPKWLRLSEEINALDYLEQASHYIRQIDTKIIAWKWVVLALHGALYGFAICACKGTMPDNVALKTKKGKKMVITFNEALKRCQDPNWMRMTVMSRHLQLTDQQKKSIWNLKDLLRNNFEHYIPKGWYIELHGMPQIAIDVLDVIRFLALDTGNRIHLTQDQKKKVKRIVFKSKRILKQRQLYKEAKFVEKMADGR
jgi:hypothetical protein